MGNLIKPSEYAKRIGISRQAVYAKIKKGILESKNIDGKIYIVNKGNAEESIAPQSNSRRGNNQQTSQPTKNFRELLAAKDETIGVLKETITDLKDTNKMITTVLRGEVDLLKEAFSEMKMLYSTRIEHLQTEEITSIDGESEEMSTEETIGNELGLVFSDAQEADDDELAWVEINDFFDESGISKKSKQEKIEKKLKKLFKKGDSRVDSFNGELIVLADADYTDILKNKK